MHPFFLFLALLLVCLGGCLLCLGGCFAIVKLGTAIFDKVKFRRLKHMVIKDPRIGINDGEGNLVFKQGRFTVTYRLLNGNGQAAQVKFLSLKRRLRTYEERVREFRRAVRDFWLYRDWVHFFEPKVFIPAVLLISILYFGVFEPLGFNVNRLRWIISSIVGLPIKSVTIEPGGWVGIAGQRRTAVDNKTEDWSYYVNPFQWLVNSDAGFIVRNRSDNYGTVAYPVKYDNTGNIEIKKEGDWIKGTVKNNTVEWEKPQGSGIRSQAVAGQSTQHLKDTIVIRDK